MMTMSRALSAGKALDYYKQEFTNSKDNYYSEAGEVKGRWYGSLADQWNLKGEVTSEQYERLVAGQDPHTGEQLIRSVSAREIVDDFGKAKTTSEHRAGWDATISAPKSVSLAALTQVARLYERTKDELLVLLRSYESAGSPVAPPREWMTATQLAEYWQLYNENNEPTTAGILKWAKRPADKFPLPHAYMGDLLRFNRDEVDQWARQEADRRRAQAEKRRLRIA